MATLVQLSEQTYLNLDTVTILRMEDGQWRIWLASPDQSVSLTPAELEVLALYLDSHASRVTYYAWLRTRPEEVPDAV